jgi:hypothetical protein
MTHREELPFDGPYGVRCPECGEPDCPWWSHMRAHELAQRGLEQVRLTEKGRAMIDELDVVPKPDDRPNRA